MIKSKSYPLMKHMINKISEEKIEELEILLVKLGQPEREAFAEEV